MIGGVVMARALFGLLLRISRNTPWNTPAPEAGGGWAEEKVEWSSNEAWLTVRARGEARAK
jgi:hypothetical protein